MESRMAPEVKLDLKVFVKQTGRYKIKQDVRRERERMNSFTKALENMEIRRLI